MKRLKILIANDDGIRSEGIAHLTRAAAQFGSVWVAAPERQCSGMSVRLTISETSEMAVYRYDFPAPVEAAWSVDGTPADCVKVALRALLPFTPDVVLSGINDGMNAGLDVAYSGTVGAATEAALHGIPAIAVSMRDDKSFEVTDHYLPAILEELLDQPLFPQRNKRMMIQIIQLQELFPNPPKPNVLPQPQPQPASPFPNQEAKQK